MAAKLEMVTDSPHTLPSANVNNHINTLKGIITHPELAVLWYYFNHAPATGHLMNILAPTHGVSPEHLLYVRAGAILSILGPWRGPKALKQHFVPELDLHKMREHVGPIKKANTIAARVASLGQPSPFPQAYKLGLRLRPGDLPYAFLQLPPLVRLQLASSSSKNTSPFSNLVRISPSIATELATDGTKPAIAGPQETLTLQRDLHRRLTALAVIGVNLLDPETRGSRHGWWFREKIFQHLRSPVVMMEGKIRTPPLLIEELLTIWRWTKKGYTTEASAEVLREMGKFFGDLLAGTARFVNAEERESRYQGIGTVNELTAEIEQMIEEAAWGLVSLYSKTSLPGIRKDIEITIPQAIAQLTLILSRTTRERTKRNLQRALGILTLYQKSNNGLPALNREVLRSFFAAPFCIENMYSITNDDSDVLTVRLHPDLSLPEDKWVLMKILRWFTLRYPFHERVVIMEKDGPPKEILAAVLRDAWLAESENSNDPAAFIALAIEKQPTEQGITVFSRNI